MNYQLFEDVFDVTNYPAGEFHLTLKKNVLELDHKLIDAERHVIEMHIRDFNGIGQLISADEVMRRNGYDIQWFVPYFPFARDDRRNSAGDSFELQLAIRMIRHYGINILILDPHSDMSGQLPHISQASAVKIFGSNGAFIENPIVVIPDSGATKKTFTWASKMNCVQASKTRDTKTGRLSGFSVDAKDLLGHSCIVVDDICDGGGTFLGLASALHEANCGPLSLCVSHGLFTKGTEPILEKYDKIYTFNNEVSDDDRIINIPFKEAYEKGVIV